MGKYIVPEIINEASEIKYAVPEPVEGPKITELLHIPPLLL